MEITNEIFIEMYQNRKDEVLSFLLKTDAVAKEESKKNGIDIFEKAHRTSSKNDMDSLFKTLDYDLITLLDVLYYVGRDKYELMQVATNEDRELKDVFINACVENMQADNLLFGRDNGYDINIYCKSASAIIENVSVAVKAIETGTIN